MLRILILFIMGCVMTVAAKEEIYIKKLPNGVKAIIKERPDTKAVAVQVWFGVGSIYENDQERGLSHFLEHMLFNGTKYTKPGEIEFEIEKKGGHINAATSFDFTYYHIEIADIFWKTALKYLYYMTTAPSLSDDMVKKEKPIVLEELNRHLDDPKNLLWDEYYKLAYKKTNYKHPVIGYRETIENYTPELVRNYFYSHYTPNNTTVVVVGNINKDEVLNEIEKTFGTVKGKKYTPPQVELEDPQTDIRTAVIKKKQITRGYVVIGWQAPSIRDKKSFTAQILEEILANGKSSVIYQELKEKGYVQSIFGGYMAHAGTSQFIFYMITDPDKIDKAKEKLFEIIKDYAKNGFDKEAVENAKRRIINRETFAREEVDDEADSIGYAVTVARDINYDIKYLENIKKVSKEDVDNFVREFLKDNNYTEVRLLPEDK
ncbi:pitrilysin family protein [Venenivibrio stagnispumantis]|uniref:Predicted Zn-dependent peptidase n=1 Tax=Venenivibrio stagnispumantis TaxID=407998 RepID=A0AA46AES6_9AQUI|nr:pitrilysin family protein [Venenivibrio stagnispumantis]MCW4573614.1 insulinase family protein [Venenivibrio stagnispumantis]SMP14122.1 Predicted Zn-dependent peptidase [Venenivibrio stagnispumantis]